MDGEPEPLLADQTMDNIEKIVKDVIAAVVDGTLTQDQASGGLLYLIASINNGEIEEINTWSRDLNAYKGIFDAL